MPDWPLSSEALLAGPKSGAAHRLAHATRISLENLEGTNWLPLSTFIVWLVCVTVGGIGFALPYPRPRPPGRPMAPVQAETLNVELASDSLPPTEVAPPPPDPARPPPLLDRVLPPQAPPMITLALPSPAIAFALPVEGPSRVVEAKQSGDRQPAAPSASTPAAAQPIEPLTHGWGEGKQPSPTYPARARREGQEGKVVVRFSVGEEGRVLAAEAVSPSPWPLLTAEAVRVIRERWRFRPGPIRLYEVSIHFELRK